MPLHPRPDPSAALRAVPSLAPDHDGPFRRLTMLGLAASAAGDRDAAVRHFRAARAAAEAVFETAAAQGGEAVLVAPMILAVACQNTAAEACRGGDEAGAVADLAHAVGRLVTTAARADVPLAMRLNCVRHLRHALRALAAVARQLDEGLLAEVSEVVTRVSGLAGAALCGGRDSATRH